MDPIWTESCKAWHFGPWAIEPFWFQAAVAAVNHGTWVARATPEPMAVPGAKPFQFSEGLAVIPIYGQIMKGESKFGGANSLAIRRQLQAAARDPEVKSIFMPVDSPGGTVAGTDEMAATIRSVSAQKPIHAHIEDLGASAAYWAASQASTLTASPSAQVGSIGVMAILEDASKLAETKGIKVHVIKTGEMKAIGVPGTMVTEAHLAHLQGKVEEFGAQFFDGVAHGRGISAEDVRSQWGSGQTWMAQEAAKMGLIDGVMRIDEAVSRARPTPTTSTMPHKISSKDTRGAILRERIAQADNSF